jgi:hypothetical protein
MKKKVEDVDYYKQQAKNEYAFREMLKTVKPDLYVIFDILQTTGINFFVVVKILRALNNVALGTGYGTVSVDIQDNKVLFVKGTESDRVNEELINKNPQRGTIEIVNE